MAKYHGTIGFASGATETPANSGIWVETITERVYGGDLLKNYRRNENAANVSDDINISNEISIVADPFANANIYAIRYATYAGTKWKVTSVDASQYPRLILSLGGMYNDA